jgi:hypothetical protein
MAQPITFEYIRTDFSAVAEKLMASLKEETLFQFRSQVDELATDISRVYGDSALIPKWSKTTSYIYKLFCKDYPLAEPKMNMEDSPFNATMLAIFLVCSTKSAFPEQLCTGIVDMFQSSPDELLTKYYGLLASVCMYILSLEFDVKELEAKVIQQVHLDGLVEVLTLFKTEENARGVDSLIAESKNNFENFKLDTCLHSDTRLPMYRYVDPQDALRDCVLGAFGHGLLSQSLSKFEKAFVPWTRPELPT